MSRKGKSTETESILMVAQGYEERGNGAWWVNQDRIFSFRDDEKSLELEVMVLQHDDYIKYHWMVRCMNFTSIERDGGEEGRRRPDLGR